MTERRITQSSADEEMRQLYETAFPAEEQIPWDDLMGLIEKMPLDFTAYYDDSGAFVGFTIVYPRETFNWFWYFAVKEELRGKGCGQQILTRLIGRYSHSSNILDMESPDQPCDNMEQRRRRHRFYRRNGFRDTHVSRTYEGITYTIMMLGPGTFTRQDYDDIIAELRRFWWPTR